MKPPNKSQNAKSLFISATDTGAGKTIFTMLLAKALTKSGLKVAVYKPIQTGCQFNSALPSLGAEDLEFIRKYCPEASVKCSYCLSLPATPELAAKEENVEINIQKIQQDYQELCLTHDAVLVEGAGGLIVPIKEGFTIADLISSLGCAVVLVVPNKLGCINQACLSAYFLKSKGLNLQGFVINNLLESLDSPSRVLQTNASFIEDYTGSKCLAKIPQVQLASNDELDRCAEELLNLNSLEWLF